MTKIKQLMIESGLSDGAASRICESLDGYEAQLKAKYETQFNKRLAAAKKVCLEETQTHKRELSRRFQVFVEARTKSIEESIRKTAVDKETEAAASLERIAGILEGVEINGQPNSELKARLQKLEGHFGTLKEERDAAISKANQSIQLAEKVMKRNRELERTIKESPQPAGGQTLTEGKGSRGRRIDKGRKGQRTRTTRRTVRQNQVPLTEGANQPQGSQSQVPSPSDIAHNMDPNL